ncbi:MAG: hypothetical protein AAFR64_13675 [Pseudomonadota bacterium]
MTDIAQLIELSQNADPEALVRAALEKDGMPESRKQLLEMLLAQPTIDAEEVDQEDAFIEDTGAEMEEVGALVQQVRAQQALLHDIAEAIGACPTCFGADEDCVDCAGTGAPGAFLPQRENFAFFVRPALERVNRERARRPRRANPHSSN